MKSNPLIKLSEHGQSIWLDYIHRDLFESGELQRLIEEDGLRGMTSNPTIFEKSIAEGRAYQKQIRSLVSQGRSTLEIYEDLTVADVQQAADIFRTVYESSGGADGYVSLEVNPHLAHDTKNSIVEARRLWAAVDRPNLMIKIPGTKAGLPAIRQCLSEGININVTLLFGLPRYREVVEAYLSALQTRLDRGQPVARVASVASFFLSRIDVMLDPRLEEISRGEEPRAQMAGALHGQVAIACAKGAYRIYREIFHGERFRRLEAQGVRPQRVLWASTSTKNPAYSDVKYVEALVGPETVNTMPRETLEAYRDHGEPRTRLIEGLDEAERALERLARLDINMDKVSQKLEDEGVEKFRVPYDKLLRTLEDVRDNLETEQKRPQTLALGDLQDACDARVNELVDQNFASRLWEKDPTLWDQDVAAARAITGAMGWLDVLDKMRAAVPDLRDFAEEVKRAGFRHVVHMGMGGSSLAPLVFRRTLGDGAGGLPLTVLDTTDPATILEVAEAVPLADTLFIVASKSGTTTEPLAFAAYFRGRLESLKGDHAGENFVAITDPGTPLVDLAKQLRYRRVFLNFPDIGGRYSALSYFGLVPAALMGIDVAALLARAEQMAASAGADVPVERNQAIVLGAAMGELAESGRDKITFLQPPRIASLGMWLEQLLAESTGKKGRGLLPVAGEPLGDPSVYGDDRLFVRFELAGAADQEPSRNLEALREAGFPLVNIRLAGPLDLAREFFRWEVATATAGSVLGINPFDQPNVQESKDNTERLLRVVAEKGELPVEHPVASDGPLDIYAAERASDAVAALHHLLDGARPDDYVALTAYLRETPGTEDALQAIRRRLRDGLHLATTLGYGPRYLHSTGQLHKGGANKGIFLQLTCDDPVDADVPGEAYSFSVLKQAQAQGDLEALRRHGRRVARIHLGQDVAAGLAALERAVAEALAR
jgi:transaldolase/glucose-6-phosphate isomerase